MEQGQSGMMRSFQTTRRHPVQLSEAYCNLAYASTAVRLQGSQISHRPGRLILGVVAALWYLITLPFRLLMGIIGILGRLAGIILGFSLMVVGMALWAGPFFIMGIPLFIIGLLLTLRCLG
jgi:hypothetical protein